MAYVLVLLRGNKNAMKEDWDQEHFDFIDSLIEKNLILLGGSLGFSIDNIHAAYLLHVQTLSEANELVKQDPYIRNDVFSAELVEWRLVGINPDAIEPRLVIRPEDASTR